MSELLFEALSVALDAAERTARRRRPHRRQRHRRAGLRRRPGRGRSPALQPRPARWVRWPGTQHVQLNPRDRTVRIPRGVRLDLGSSAKALAADRAAARIAGRIGGGVLVSLGGDVAVAGPPPAGGWADRASPASRRRRPSEVDQVVAITHGGLASSATVGPGLAGRRP